MRKTHATGKRIAPDRQQVNRPAKIESIEADSRQANNPAEKKHVKLNGKLLVLIVAVVVAMTALIIVPRLTRAHEFTVENTTQLNGVWSFNNEATYSFDDERKGQLDLGDVQFAYTYTVSGSKLKLDYEDKSVEDAEYQFSIDGDRLTLEGGKGTTGGTYQLSRVD